MVSRETGDPTASPVSTGGAIGSVSSPTSRSAAISAAAPVQARSRSRRSAPEVPETTFMVPNASRSWAGAMMPAWCAP
jgi:hypothetical protein